MGFLSNDEVIDCSATDLIGQYVGQTGPKVIQKFDEALGKVLFVDEAYRLGEGTFAKEAIDEFVDCLTKPKYKSKLIVVLAGYEDEINRLLSVNPGLSSRFPEEIFFHNLDPEMCLDLLVKQLKKNDKFELGVCDSASLQQTIKDYFKALAALNGWGNGRDIDTLTQRIIGEVLKTGVPVNGKLRVTWETIKAQLSRLHVERRARTLSQSKDLSEKFPSLNIAEQCQQYQPPAASAQNTSFNNAIEDNPPPPVDDEDQSHLHTSIQRDPGVPDDIWHQLQQDAQAQTKAEQDLAEAISASEAAQRKLTQEAEIETKRLEAESQAQAQAEKDDEEARRRQEAMRIKAIEARRKAEQERQRQEQLLLEQQREAKAQQKLRQMGVCPVGFRWIKQAGGYRCAGGSHFIGNEQLGM